MSRHLAKATTAPKHARPFHPATQLCGKSRHVPANHSRYVPYATCLEEASCSYLSSSDINRRALLGTLSAAILGTLLAPAAQAKPPAIVSILRGNAGERDVLTTTTGVKYALDAPGWLHCAYSCGMSPTLS